MLLHELPKKTFHHLLKSVTWTEVDGSFPIKNWFGRFVSRVAQPSRWGVSARKNYRITGERMIGALVRIRITLARLRD
jgi:hypothetical protein